MEVGRLAKKKKKRRRRRRMDKKEMWGRIEKGRDG